MEDLRSDALLSKTTELKGYKILPPCVLYARIGAGGMGAVYRGHHLNLDIDVAVKCLKPSLVDDDPTFVDRFKREGRSAAKINHQNVIRVFDVAENLGLHYLIMEFVAGETARQRVERKGALQLGEALQIVYESSLGLGEAHRMGIIHRDVKPDNLLISSRGQVKVADLGLAKPAVSSGQSMLSMAGQVMGTPPYMPPEQWGEGTVTAASDVWAMGAVLYYLLTGREAMSGESLAAIMSKIVLQDFPDVREIRPDIPDSVIEVLNKATAKAPGDRYLDAYELADAIGQLAEHRMSLADADAGTTELVTMLSPPPNARINEIKKLLATKTPTVREAMPGLEPAAARKPAAKGGRFPWAVVLLVVLLGGGGAGYFYRDVLFGSGSDNVQPEVDVLAEAKGLQAEGKFVEALVAARDVFTETPTLTDSSLLGQLRDGAQAQLKAALTKSQPTEAVEPDAQVTFAGSLGGIAVQELLLGDIAAGDIAAEFTGDEFRADLVPPTDGRVMVRARVTDDDTLDIDEWLVTFRPVSKPIVKPTLAPASFAGNLTTEPKLGARNSIGKDRVTLIGKASEKGLDLYLGEKVLSDVQWAADGTFRVAVDLPKEGRNALALTVRRSGETTETANAQQFRSIEIVRLMEQPTIALVAPTTPTSSTLETELTLEITADEWTRSVTAKAGDQTIEFANTDKTTWRAKTPLQLGDGKNTAELVATNLTDKVRKQPLEITCTAKPLEINDITLSLGVKDWDVTAGKTYYVNRQPRLAARFTDPNAKLVANGRPTESPFRPNLKEGTSNDYELRAEKGLRKSKPTSFTIVYDTTEPTIAANRLQPAKPNTEVTLRGTWSDDFAIESVATITGATAQLTNKSPTTGEWSLRVRVGATPTTFTLFATDKAGNKQQVSTTVEILKPQPTIKPKPEVPNPGIAKPVVLQPEEKPKPAVKLSTKINPVLFEPVGKLNQMGFPRELRHKETGVELVAINFVDTMAPSVYVAKRVVSDKQWDGNGGSEPKVEVPWLDVYEKVRSSRFEGLEMVTKQQWTMVTNSSTNGLIRGEKAEWLAYDDGDSVTMRPIVEGDKVTLYDVKISNKYLGFRVAFAPK